MKSRLLIGVAALVAAIAPAQAAKPKDAWTRHINEETSEFRVEHRGGLTLYCQKQGGVIRVTIPGVIKAPVFITAGTAKAALLEPGSDAADTRGVLMADNLVIPAIMAAGVFVAGGKTWKLESEKDRRDVGLFFRICKAAA